VTPAEEEGGDDRRSIWLGANLGGEELRVLKPIQSGPVGATVMERWPAVGGREVVHDHQATGAQPVCWLDGWLAALALAAAVESEQIERPNGS
jgi:hypothetical protein